MVITDTMPVRLNALSISEDAPQAPNTVKVGDVGSVILCRMNNGAVFRIWGLMMSSIHRVRYDLHGERGLISTADPNPWSTVRIHHEPWMRTDGQKVETTYVPDWPSHPELAAKAGHGGGDFWVCFHFANAIRSGTQPFLNVYRATAMAAVSVQAWRSCLADGQPLDIPEFANRRARAQVADDHWSPFPEDAAPGQPPPSIRGTLAPSRTAVARARKVWKKMGYSGS
jgi:predicted dehydrogenase